MLDADESTGLEEREGISRMIEHVPEVLVEQVQLLAQRVVVGDGFFVGDDDRCFAFVQRAKFCKSIDAEMVRQNISERAATKP